MILAHVLLKYEIKSPAGQGRPKNLTAHEYIFPDPEGLIVCQERKDVPESLFA